MDDDEWIAADVLNDMIGIFSLQKSILANTKILMKVEKLQIAIEIFFKMQIARNAMHYNTHKILFVNLLRITHNSKKL